MQNGYWLLPSDNEHSPDDGAIVAGKGKYRIFAVLLLSIVGMSISVWLGRSVSLEPEAPRPVDPSTFELLESVQLPVADFAELAMRIGGRGQVETTFQTPNESQFDLGARQAFWVTDIRGNRFQVQTTLWHKTAHSRMWVQENLKISQQQLADLGLVLEEQIYLTVLSLLASDPTSHDMDIELVFTDKLGPGMAGYFSPLDLISPKISETSNGRLMILVNAVLAEDKEALAQLVAHEIQHVIHWDLDPNETVWMQEGFSGFAEQLVGQAHNPRRSAYLAEPDLQLNAWPLDGDFALHYGAASLLINYLNDRLGPEFVSALAHHPSDGLEALNALILKLELFDAARNRFLTAEDVVLDWGLANYLQLSSGPYAYTNSMQLPRASATEYPGNCTERMVDQSVSQYGFDYIRIRCDEPGVLEFSGAASTKLLPTTPHSGQYFFWSNRGDMIDTRLTRLFDFTGVEGPLTLQFWTWYDLEKGSDFVYLLASEEGHRWSFLETQSGNPPGETVGKQFGFGFSGINRRQEWSRQTVDLSEFAGKRVTLRFQYVTDTSRTGEGFLIDDLSVPETGYRADVEDGPGGWESDGFVRVRNTIPQQFRVSVIRSAEPAAVEHLTLDSSNRARVRFDAGEEFVLVVMGATRHTRQPAFYTLGLRP